MVRNSGPINLGPVRWSGNPDQPIFGPVRWSGIPDRTKLVRIFGPETRTTGPDQQNFGPVRIFFDFKIEEKRKPLLFTFKLKIHYQFFRLYFFDLIFFDFIISKRAYDIDYMIWSFQRIILSKNPGFVAFFVRLI